MNDEFGVNGYERDCEVEMHDERLDEYDDVDQGGSRPCLQSHRPSSQPVPAHLHASLV